MVFKEHSNLEGKHAFLSPSKYHWINYDSEKLAVAYSKYMATVKGTELHDFACRCIKLNQRLPASKKTLNLYVNDAIGYKMTPEQPLYYSENCFGTADAISFRNGMLRIHDLKTGGTVASIHQLEVYAAIFCLEYKVDPYAISIELRIYQSNEVIVSTPESEHIKHIMDKIVEFDKQIEQFKE